MMILQLSMIVSIFTRREVDWLSLVGNIGGYVGICLGYCLLQLPEFIVKSIKSAVVYLRNKYQQSSTPEKP